MKNFLYKDDLIMQVLYALIALLAFAISMGLLWLLFFYTPATNLGKAASYVLVPIFAPVAFYAGVMALGVAVAPPESKWAQKGFKTLYSASGSGEEVIVLIPFYIVAIIIAAILRLVGVNGYATAAYSDVIFKKQKNKSADES